MARIRSRLRIRTATECFAGRPITNCYQRSGASRHIARDPEEPLETEADACRKLSATATAGICSGEQGGTAICGTNRRESAGSKTVPEPWRCRNVSYQWVSEENPILAGQDSFFPNRTLFSKRRIVICQFRILLYQNRILLLETESSFGKLGFFLLKQNSFFKKRILIYRFRILLFQNRILFLEREPSFGKSGFFFLKQNSFFKKRILIYRFRILLFQNRILFLEKEPSFGRSGFFL